MADLAGWRSVAPLIGRDVELDLLQQRLMDPWVRVVTLVGCPGVGKSALAFHAALAFYELFRGAVLVADPTVTDAELPTEPVRSALIVLDGADVASAAALVGRLVATQPGAKLLVTRRGPLRIRSEAVVPVPPLEMPAAFDAAGVGDVQRLSRVPAVALFVARARAVDPAFALTRGNASAVAAVCWQLDGLPLAIELAAQWVGVLPVENILEYLSSGSNASPLDLLSDSCGDGAPSHRSVREALTPAYDGLTAEERSLLRRLAALDGEFSLAAVAALWEGAAETRGAQDVPSSALGALRTLVSQGLIVRTSEAHPPRFKVLNLIRAFVLERGGDTLELGDAGRHARLLPVGRPRALLAAPTTDGAEMRATGAKLSQRERVVMRLVAQGKSNREVAEELALSERTVAHHLTSIFNKLGVSSRTAAAARALRNGLA